MKKGILFSWLVIVLLGNVLYAQEDDWSDIITSVRGAAVGKVSEQPDHKAFEKMSLECGGCVRDVYTFIALAKSAQKKGFTAHLSIRTLISFRRGKALSYIGPCVNDCCGLGLATVKELELSVGGSGYLLKTVPYILIHPFSCTLQLRHFTTLLYYFIY